MESAHSEPFVSQGFMRAMQDIGLALRQSDQYHHERGHFMAPLGWVSSRRTFWLSFAENTAKPWLTCWRSQWIISTRGNVTLNDRNRTSKVVYERRIRSTGTW